MTESIPLFINAEKFGSFGKAESGMQRITCKDKTISSVQSALKSEEKLVIQLVAKSAIMRYINWLSWN